MRRFEFSSKRNTHTVMFDLYDKSYTMDLENFSDACKIPQWGILSEPHKSEYNDFIASIRLRVIPFLCLAVVHRLGALGAACSMWSTTDFHRKGTVRGEAESWVHGRSKEVPPYYAENDDSST